MNLEDFFEVDRITAGFAIKIANHSKIQELSDESFAEFYLALMTEYQTKDGWWKDKKSIPHCSECNEEIKSPNELRRYFGQSLHPQCFKEIYNPQEITSKNQRAYFDRIAEL